MREGRDEAEQASIQKPGSSQKPEIYYSLKASQEYRGEDDVFCEHGRLVSVNPQTPPHPPIFLPSPWPTVGKPRANMFSTSAAEIRAEAERDWCLGSG
ncbi:hypothetical protein MHYP_G00107520 [Metynnis hypsauchen]